MNNKQKGLLYVLAFSFFWAIFIVIARFALAKKIDPLVFIFHISVISSILLIINVLLFRKKELKKINKKDIPKLITAGIVGNALAGIFGIIGLSFSTSINYGFIVKTTVVFTILLAHFFLKEKITKTKTSLVIILLLGAYLISTKGQTLIPQIGDILILLAALGYSISNIIVKQLSKRISSDLITAFKYLSTAIFLFLVVFILNKEFYFISYPTIIIFAGIFAALTQTFLNKTIQTTTASYMTMMSMITPVIVVVLAFIFLGEKLNLYSTIGGLLIIISGILINKTNIHIN